MINGIQATLKIACHLSLLSYVITSYIRTLQYGVSGYIPLTCLPFQMVMCSNENRTRSGIPETYHHLLTRQPDVCVHRAQKYESGFL